MADSEKFAKILQQYEVRKKKLIDTIAFEKAELATRGIVRNISRFTRVDVFCVLQGPIWSNSRQSRTSSLML